MKIYLDNIIYSLQKIGGISAYWSELLKRFLLTNISVQFIEHDKIINMYRKTFNIPNELLMKEYGLPLSINRYFSPLCKAKAPAIFHSSYYRIIPKSGILNVVTVHDFSYEFHRKGLARLIHTKQKKAAISSAMAIICVSEYTKRDLLSFFPDIDPCKIEVIYNGVNESYFPISKNSSLEKKFGSIIDKKFILFVGHRPTYKNFHVALDVLSELSNFFFLVVGGNLFSQDEKKQLKMKLGNRFIHLIGINNEELNFLYNKAFCFFYPSVYEGFGIPILESMSAGCPVVTTNRTSIPEVGGNAALMSDKITVDDFIYKIKLLESSDFRNHVIQEGFNQASKFSWDKCFNHTLRVYQNLTDTYNA